MTSTSVAKQVPPYATLNLALRTFGGKFPEWAERYRPPIRAPDIEIVIVRDATGDDVAKELAQEALGVKAPNRILIVDETFSASNLKYAGVFWIIRAPSRDLDAIAEICVFLARDHDFAEINQERPRGFGGRSADAVMVSAGAVVSGMYDDETSRRVKAVLRDFAEDGCSDAANILHSIAKPDYDQGLVKYDQFLSSLADELGSFRSLKHSAHWWTYDSGVSASAWVIFASNRKRQGA